MSEQTGGPPPTYTVALAGNPNAGKSTIFNNLTGARQKVANYPGTTVETREGICRYDKAVLRVVDLPGTYGLTPFSVEEIIARNFILDEQPDVVVDVVDASNLERNLYLTTQLIELGRPLVIAFNMSDIAAAQGLKVDLRRLSELLGAPIVQTVGHRNEGTDALLKAIVETARRQDRYEPRKVTFGNEIEEEIARLSQLVADRKVLPGHCRPRWAAIKLLEGDADFLARISSPDVIQAAERSRRHLRNVFGDAPEIVIAERRYGFISGACQQALQSTVELRHTVSDKIDEVLTHPLLGLPIFLVLMAAVFGLVFALGDPLAALVERFFDNAAILLTRILPAGRLQSLMVDGLLRGVGGVIVFVPNVALLFLAIAILEDSGYMARAAFILDRLMQRIGLHGKSFIPMVLGFGCSVPAIMATRILEHRRDRLTTMLVLPLMSCSARLPVYVLLAGAFFPESPGRAVLAVYLLGIALAVAMARVFRSTLFRGEATPLVMELPPYRAPTLRGALIHTWDRTKMFLRKAGTVILALALVMWALSTFPTAPDLEADYKARMADAKAAGRGDEVAALSRQLAREKLERSYAGRLGHVLAPILRPVGLGDWKVATALVAGFGAKEIVISTLGTLYSLGSESGNEALREALVADTHFNPLVAFTLMVFVLTYVPCVATVVAVGRETGSLRWPLFLIGYTTVLAWATSFAVYQGGRLLGLG